jgi:hypothetical protein
MTIAHQNARMTLLGRVGDGETDHQGGAAVAEVAAGFGVSERTARKWLARPAASRLEVGSFANVDSETSAPLLTLTSDMGLEPVSTYSGPTG